MLSIVIPTLDASESLGRLLTQCRQHDVEIIVSDGLSEDDTLGVASAHQARLAVGTPSRGTQLRRGAQMAQGDWLLFLHADSVLAGDWFAAVNTHMDKYSDKAGFFSLKYDSPKWAARWVELMVAWRSLPVPIGWALPYGDQGLLISRSLYEHMGGYPDWPLFEDVKLIEVIGTKRLRKLTTHIVTCAQKHEEDGFIRRGWRNFRLMRRYKNGEKIETLMKAYR